MGTSVLRPLQLKVHALRPAAMKGEGAGRWFPAASLDGGGVWGVWVQTWLSVSDRTGICILALARLIPLTRLYRFKFHHIELAQWYYCDGRVALRIV